MKKYLDQTQFDSIFAILEGIKAAADNDDIKCCKRLAHACTLVMTDLSIEGEQEPELAPDGEDDQFEGRNKAG